MPRAPPALVAAVTIKENEVFYQATAIGKPRAETEASGRNMSCNGCRVLRKGCSDGCLLRPCLAAVEGADAQGHATLFLAKFFGRAGLMGFISNVSESQRPGRITDLQLSTDWTGMTMYSF